MDEKLDSLTELLCRNPPIHERLPPIMNTVAGLASHLPPADDPLLTAISPDSLDPESMRVSPPPFLDTGQIREELSLSQKHSTAPQHLLSWECSPLTLSDTELQYPIALEIRGAKLPTSTEPPTGFGSPSTKGGWVLGLSLSQLTLLTQYYFSYFHPSCLVLDETHFYSHVLNHVLRGNFPESVETCLVLFVLALGATTAAHMGHEEWVQPGGNNDSNIDMSGLGLFNLGLDMFRQVEGVNWASVQCLLLIAYAITARKLKAWSEHV